MAAAETPATAAPKEEDPVPWGLTQEQADDMTATFVEMDVDNSGLVNTADVVRGLLLGGLRVSDREASELVRRFDADGDGMLDLGEWLTLAESVIRGTDEMEMPREVFRILMDSETTTITPTSFYVAACRYMGAAALTEEEVELAMSAAGVVLSPEGGLAFEPFVEFLEKVRLFPDVPSTGGLLPSEPDGRGAAPPEEMPTV